jgi:hypothetical protein
MFGLSDEREYYQQRCEDLEQHLDKYSARILELERAIAQHRDQKCDDRCWLDDEELYKVIGGGGNNSLPCREEFIKNCQRYFDSRCKETDWPSYQEIEMDNKKLAFKFDILLNALFIMKPESYIHKDQLLEILEQAANKDLEYENVEHSAKVGE